MDNNFKFITWFWFTYNIDKGGNSLPKRFEHNPNIRSNL